MKFSILKAILIATIITSLSNQKRIKRKMDENLTKIVEEIIENINYGKICPKYLDLVNNLKSKKSKSIEQKTSPDSDDIYWGFILHIKCNEDNKKGSLIGKLKGFVGY